jgi:Fe-Mn family superoxide dismutase
VFEPFFRAEDEMPIGELLGGPSVLSALTAARGQEPFHLSPLPYAYEALEPVIDHETMHWHHDVHHRGYVEKLNQALSDAKIQGLPLEEILARVSEFSEAVRVNGGGHWNHTFYWSILTDKKEDQELTPEILKAIDASFGSFDNFKAEFVKMGLEHAGSGWLWMLRTEENKLRLATTSVHDNPLMDVCETKGVPVLACDLWEHAYYLKFKAHREEFLRKFFVVINWARVGCLFAHGAESSGVH